MSTHSVSPYTSHAEALARSLAIAAAQREMEDEYREDEFEDPMPSSAFSDYGSECSSAAYTPSEEGDDPFEFDNDASSCHSSMFGQDQDDVPPPDNFSLFAAAIQMNNYVFVLPSFPPQKLLEKRPKFGSDGSIQSKPQQCAESTSQPDPFAASFAQAAAAAAAASTSESASERVEPSAVLKSEPTSEDPMDNTLAARRLRPDLSSGRGYSSFTGVPDRPVPTLRRINTDEANFGSRILRGDKPPREEICLDHHNIRPCASAPAASSAPPPLSDFFQAGPPTPISPPSPEDTPAPPQSKMETMMVQHQQNFADNEMSPPATPDASSSSSSSCSSSSLETSWSFLGLESCSIPRHFSGTEEELFSFDLFSSEFQYYHDQQQQCQRPPPLFSGVSVASSNTIGCFF